MLAELPSIIIRYWLLKYVDGRSFDSKEEVWQLTQRGRIIEWGSQKLYNSCKNNYNSSVTQASIASWRQSIIEFQKNIRQLTVVDQKLLSVEGWTTWMVESADGIEGFVIN